MRRSEKNEGYLDLALLSVANVWKITTQSGGKIKVLNYKFYRIDN